MSPESDAAGCRGLGRPHCERTDRETAGEAMPG
jgi:hypothetical protein